MDLEFEFPGFTVGVAEDEQRTTGCTVFVFEPGNRMAADVRGGAPGLTDVDYAGVSAICLAGGSLLGLEAAGGAAAEIWDRAGRKTGWFDIPAVVGAILNDWGPGRTTYPDHEMGRAAVRAARPGLFPMGRRGPGCSATYGKVQSPIYWGGQGGTVREVAGGRVAAFVVVNAVGMVYDRSGAPAVGSASTGESAGGNTTLSVLVTDLRLGRRELVQWGRQVHTSMARAIHPFHTITDGDVLFAVSTMAVDRPIATEVLGMEASDVMWDAVLAAVAPA